MSNEEEKRARKLALNRERQRRWRAEHKWLGEQRRLATYGMSEAHKKEGFDTNNTEVEEIEFVIPETGEKVRVLADGRTRSGKVILALWRKLKAEQEPGIEVDLGL